MTGAKKERDESILQGDLTQSTVKGRLLWGSDF